MGSLSASLSVPSLHVHAGNVNSVLIDTDRSILISLDASHNADVPHISIMGKD